MIGDGLVIGDWNIVEVKGTVGGMKVIVNSGNIDKSKLALKCMAGRRIECLFAGVEIDNPKEVDELMWELHRKISEYEKVEKVVEKAVAPMIDLGVFLLSVPQIIGTVAGYRLKVAGEKLMEVSSRGS